MTAQGREARALDAAQAPLEATQMRLTVHLAEFASGNAPLRFDLVVDPGQITLEARDGRRTGSLHLALLQCTLTGKILLAKQEKVNLSMAESTYQNALTNGFSLAREWALEVGVGQLRIAVCDGGSDNVGSIKIPLSSK